MSFQWFLNILKIKRFVIIDRRKERTAEKGIVGHRVRAIQYGHQRGREYNQTINSIAENRSKRFGIASESVQRVEIFGGHHRLH